ncbi:hypothetical protein GGR58DRAFT_495201 [Xylaria digitata]|nr:hypothetical protein GGR58DRAFT_495201 [Xylaria digitata]
MGNVISLIRKQRIMEDAVQIRNSSHGETHSTHSSELEVAVANLKHSLASFEHAQRLDRRSETFLPSTANLMSFNRDIKILSAANEWILASALLDTQCQVGNWISRRLVERLGKLSSISTEFIPPEVVEASGGPVSACGVIDLDWKWHPQATRNHVCQFYVFPFSSHLDVLFGVEYIVSERLLRVNELALAPLVKHKKSKKEDKAAIDHAKKRQQEEKAALEERRKKQQQGGSEQGESQSGSQQQGS